MPNRLNNPEGEYFAREDAEKRHKLGESQKKEKKKKQEEDDRKQHLMKCPKCGHDLSTTRFGFVDIDQCGNCGAMVLDRGGLERIVSEGKSVLKPLVDFFRQMKP